MKRRSTINRKETKAFYLERLAEQAQYKLIDRRDFMRTGMALGLSATTALVLFQACGGEDATVAPAVTTAPGVTTAPVTTTAPGATTAPGVAPTAQILPTPAATPVPQLSTEVVGENLNYLVHRFPEISTMPAGKDLLTCGRL